MYQLNTFVNETGARMNKFQEVQKLAPKIEEALKLIGHKQFLEGRQQINEILNEVNGWPDSSSLDPMID